MLLYWITVGVKQLYPLTFQFDNEAKGWQHFFIPPCLSILMTTTMLSHFFLFVNYTLFTL